MALPVAAEADACPLLPRPASGFFGEATSDQSSSSVSPWEDGLGGTSLGEPGELSSTMTSSGRDGGVGWAGSVGWVVLGTNLGMMEMTHCVCLFVSVSLFRSLSHAGGGLQFLRRTSTGQYQGR